MKKTYSKPRIYAESFELMEHIAGPCNGSEDYKTDFYVSHRNGTDCYFIFVDNPDDRFFTGSSCTVTEDMGNYYHTSIECYNTPTPYVGYFAS